MGWYLALEFSEAAFFFYLAVNFESLTASTILDTSHKGQSISGQKGKKKREGNVETDRGTNSQGINAPREKQNAAPGETKENLEIDIHIPERIGSYLKMM